MIHIKRIYFDAEPKDGYRILVDRLWPRGISKEVAKLDEWDKEISPSTELRKQFGHIPEKFNEFVKEFKLELQSKKDDLKRIKQLAEKQNVTLLYAAKNETENNAAVLLEVLNNLE